MPGAVADDILSQAEVGYRFEESRFIPFSVLAFKGTRISMHTYGIKNKLNAAARFNFLWGFACQNQF